MLTFIHPQHGEIIVSKFINDDDLPAIKVEWNPDNDLEDNRLEISFSYDNESLRNTAFIGVNQKKAFAVVDLAIEEFKEFYK